MMSGMGNGGELPTGLVSFLLTDVEGSTALWDADPSSTARAIERHDELIDSIVRAHRGTVLKHKGEGDSTLSVFHTAHEAVAASDEVVQAIRHEPWPETAPILVRAAVHTGEAFERDGDYFGPTLNRAARVRSLARGGQILLTRATAEAVVDALPDGRALVDHGRHELRGITRVERVFELVPDASDTETPVGAATTADDGLPPALRNATNFVGRETELAALERAWQRVRGGQHRVMLLKGEPGIGKTRLTAEFAQRIVDEAVVLFGRCEEDLPVPYQPFIEGIRPWLQALDANELAAIEPLTLADAARFWPEIAGRVPSLPLPQTSDAELDRYASFQATAELLARASQTRAVLFVIDDIQWATSATVLLLRHLVKADATARVLFVCTARDSEIGADHPFAAALADFRRAGAVDVVELGGLDREAIAQYVASVGELDGRDPASVAEQLDAETAGNPFFISELMASPGIPAGVRDVVANRVARLPESAQSLLAVAAVLGPECSYDDLVASLDDAVRAELLPALEAALAAGFLLDRNRRFAFKHALVRDCVLDRLSSVRRAVLHERVAEAIAAAPNADERARELAFHFAAAGTQPARAARYAYLTAVQSLSVAAVADAQESLDLAIAQLAAAPDPDPGLRIDIDIAVGYALRAADYAGGRDVALRALGAAREIGDVDRAAEAALLMVEAMGVSGNDPEALAAIARVADLDAPPGPRSQVLSALSQGLERSGEHDRARQLSDDALALARASGSDEALYFALYGKWVVSLSDATLAERNATIDELLEVAQRIGAEKLMSAAIFFRGIDGIEGGDRRSFEHASELLRQRGNASNWMHDITVRSLPWRKAFLALLDGRWDDAARHSDEMVLQAGGDSHPDLLAAYAGQVFQRGRELGEHEQFLPMLEQAIADDSELVAYQAGLAMLSAEMGDAARARALLDDLTAGGVRAIRHDQELGATLAMLAETCAFLGDAAVAAQLLDALQTFAGRLILIHSAVCVLGAADRYVGMMHHVLGHFDAALAALDRAESLEASVDSRPLVTRTQFWKAWVLRDHGAAVEARTVASTALVTAEELGMQMLATHLRGLIDSLG